MKDIKTLGYLALISILSLLLNAVAIYFLFSWLISPIIDIEISYAHAIGLSIFRHFLSPSQTANKVVLNELMEQLGYHIARVAFYLCLGKITHLLIQLV